MEFFRPASVWVRGGDDRGFNCWRNTITGHVVYSNPERSGPTYGPNPNAQPFAEASSNTAGNSSPWEEYFDLKSNHSYWYNRNTGETTWNDPKVPAKQQPPPPNVEKREQDQWFRIDDAKKGKVWYNEKTGTYQHERPACLTKYK